MKPYDHNETRPPASREAAAFRDLRAILSVAKPRAPALRDQLRGVVLADLKTRADLARLPLVRKGELKEMQAARAPFGGLNAMRVSAFKRLLMSPGSIFEPEGQAKDWWGSARALHAAGIARGDVVLNCFSYHLTPGGHIMEAGAHALGCAVIPAGTADVAQQLQAIAHFRPTAYCGTPDFLKLLLDRAARDGVDASCLRTALVSGAALPGSLRTDIESRGVRVRQAYASADLGVVAYETSAPDGSLVPGMHVNEGLIVEIVRPGTGDPVPPGDVGEVVVTRLNADYPLLRFATGDLSALEPGPSPCGRTNLRIKGWLGRADQTTKVKGLFVHPNQVAEVRRRHPELGALRLVVTREREQDTMVLHAEVRDPAPDLGARVTETLRALTHLRGGVTLVAPGTLPNDGRVIADERPVGA